MGFVLVSDEQTEVFTVMHSIYWQRAAAEKCHVTLLHGLLLSLLLLVLERLYVSCVCQMFIYS